VRLQHQAFELFADYHQFYLWDKGTDPQAPVDYTDEDVERRVIGRLGGIILRNAAWSCPRGSWRYMNPREGRWRSLRSSPDGIGFGPATVGSIRLMRVAWRVTTTTG
jgi:hypothetical protein